MSPHVALTQGMVDDYAQGREAYCLCGDLLVDVPPAPRGSVHWARAWQLVAARLCPTYDGFGCYCKCRCLMSRFMALVPEGTVDLRLLASMLHLWASRSRKDILAERGARLAKATLRGGKATKAVVEEWKRYERAIQRMKTVG